MRDALERASARHTAVIVAAGATAKALLYEIGVTVEGRVLGDDLEQRVDEARADRDTVGGVVEVRALGVPPGLGSYATKEERLDARLAATLMGTQAVKGVEIGAGFDLARRRGSEAHDEILRDDRGLYRETNRAGGIEGGVSNGEEVVVRAAMKPLPTLMRPLASVDLETSAPGEALVERSDTGGGRGAGGRGRGLRRLGACARGAREVRRGCAGGLRRRLPLVPGADRLATAHALNRHLAVVGFMGAGKSTLGPQVAERLGRPFIDLDRDLEQDLGTTIPEFFEQRGEKEFRLQEEGHAIAALRLPDPAVIALGGGAVQTRLIRNELRDRAFTVLLEVDPDTAWQRSAGGDRPLARDESEFHALYERRRELYDAVAEAHVYDVDDMLLAAAGVHVHTGALESLGSLLGGGDVALVSDPHVGGIYGAAAQVALGARLASVHEVPQGEAAKTVAVAERLWSELRLDRDGLIVALGGGSTTDLAGFVAATYLRGVPWVAVPTTIVGQVDAAIGGKTAIDLPQGKNLAGAFHWPVRAVVDPATLATLAEDERREGMAEVVKTGLLAGEPLWELPAQEFVRRCAAFKAAVCLRDPDEHGDRAILNLGHTFAHALEAAADYDGVTHGQAVALGLLAALRLSGRATEVVEEVLSPKRVRVDRERAWAALQRDKKTRGGELRVVLLTEEGPVVETRPEPEVRSALDELIAE